MANRVVSWVLTAHDRTDAAFNSFTRKLRTARQSTDEHRRSMDGLDSSARKTSRGMDDSGNSITRSGRASRGASKDHDSLKSSLTKAAGAAGFLTAMMSLLTFPAAAAGAQLLGAAIRSLVAGFFALGGAIGPAIGALGALPGLLSAVAQGVGVVKFATGGIGAALKGMATEAGAGAKKTTDGASKAAGQLKKQEAAAEGVRSATRALAQAQQQAADQITAANRQVEQAERRLADTHRDALAAQERLTEARRDAVREIEELRRRLAGLALSEEEAVFAVLDAARELESAKIWQGFAPNDEVFRRADLAYRKAVANLDEVKRERSEANAELVESEQRGVEGSENVVEAMSDVVQIQEDIKEATREVAEAQAAAARTQVEGADSIAEAQYQLARAIKDASSAMEDFGDAAEAAGSKAQSALDKLNPSARRFAEFLFSLKPQMDALRESAGSQLFPALEQAIRNLLPLLPMLNTLFANTGGAIGQVAVKASELMASGPFAADMKVLGEQNIVTISRMGDVFVALMNIMRNLMVAAMPLVDWITKVAVAFAQYTDRAVAAGRESGRLTGFFERSREVLTVLGQIIGHVGSALFTIFKAGSGLGNELLHSIERITAQWDTWLKSVAGQNALATWFNESRGVLHELGRLIGDAAKGLAGIGGGPEMSELISKIRTDLLPAVLRLAELGGTAFSSQFIDTVVRLVDLFGQLAGSGGPLIIFLDILEKVFAAFSWALDNIPGMKELITIMAIFRAAVAAIQLLNFVTGLGRVISLMIRFSVVTKLAAAAQWLWNAAMMANPIGVIILAVVGFVAVIFGLFKLLQHFFGTTKAILIIIAVLFAPIVVALAPLIAVVYLLWKHWSTIWNALKDLVGGAANFFVGQWQMLQNVAQAVWGFIGSVVSGAMGFVRDFIVGTLNFIVGVWNAIWGAISAVTGGVWGFIRAVVGGGIGFVRDVVIGTVNVISGVWSSIWNGIGGVIGGVWNYIRNVVGGAVGWIRDIIEGFLSGISNSWHAVWGGISNFFGGIMEGVKRAFDGAIGFLRGVWNAFVNIWNGIELKIPGIDIPLGPKIGGFTIGLPDLPRLATGGRITSGGLAWVGEQGPELAHLAAGSSVLSNPMSAALVEQGLDLSDYVARSGGSSQPVAPSAPQETKPPVHIEQTFHNSHVDAQESAEAIHWLLKTKGA